MKKRRFLAMLLCICMIAGTVPQLWAVDDVNVDSEYPTEIYDDQEGGSENLKAKDTQSILSNSISLLSAIDYSGTFGATNNLTWEFDISTYTLTISGIGGIPSYMNDSEDVPWYEHRNSIRTVIINEGVTAIGDYAFYQCYNITNITLPNSLTSIGACSFTYVSNMQSLTITENVSYIAETAFIGMTQLKNIYVANNNLYYTSIDGVLYNKSETILHTYPVEKSDTEYIIKEGVTQIPYSLLVYTSHLRILNIPSTVTTINITDRQFYTETSLEEISVSEDNQVFSSIDGVLFDKDALYLIVYPCANPSTTYIIPESALSVLKHAFSYVVYLKDVHVHENINSLEYAFANCNNLTEAYFYGAVPSIFGNQYADPFSNVSPAFKIYYIEGKSGWTKPTWTALNGTIYNTDTFVPVTFSYSINDDNISATIIGYNGTATSIIIPSTIDGYTVTQIGDFAFFNCGSLTSVIIPNTVVSIGMDAFRGCVNLDTITIPNTVTAIASGAFYGCINLKDMTIQNGVKFIAPEAFAHCYSLTSVTIPSSVISIGQEAFNTCINLTSMYFYGDVPSTWGNSVFGSNIPTGFTIYYIEGKSGWTKPTWIAPDGTVYNTATFTLTNIPQVEFDTSEITLQIGETFNFVGSATQANGNIDKVYVGIVKYDDETDGIDYFYTENINLSTYDLSAIPSFTSGATLTNVKHTNLIQDTLTLGVGKYVLRMWVNNDQGETSGELRKIINVVEAATTNTVLTFTADKTKVKAGEPITFTATATDDVDTVAFIADGANGVVLSYADKQNGTYTYTREEGFSQLGKRNIYAFPYVNGQIVSSGGKSIEIEVTTVSIIRFEANVYNTKLNEAVSFTIETSENCSGVALYCDDVLLGYSKSDEETGSSIFKYVTSFNTKGNKDITAYPLDTSGNRITSSCMAISIFVDILNPISDISYAFANNHDDFGYDDFHYPILDAPINAVGGNACSLYKHIFMNIYTRMYGNTSLAKYLYNNQGTWGGNCFGMIASLALINQSHITGISIDSFDSTYNIMSDMELSQISTKIDSIQLQMFIESINIAQEDISFIIQRNRTEGNLQEIVDLVENYVKNGNNPIEIGIWGQQGGHSVFPYDIKHYNNSTEIFVYDPNQPFDANRKITLTKTNGAYSSWEYTIFPNSNTVWGTEKTNSAIRYCTFDTMVSLWDRRGELNHPDYAISAIEKWWYTTITDSNQNSVVIYNGEIISSTIPNVYVLENSGVLLDSNYEDANKTLVYLPVGTYTFTSDNLTEVSMANVNSFVTFTASTPVDEVTFTVDDSKINGNNISSKSSMPFHFTIDFEYTNELVSDFESMTITGTTNNSLEVEKVSGGVLVGDISNAEIIMTKDNNTVKHSVNSNNGNSHIVGWSGEKTSQNLQSYYIYLMWLSTIMNNSNISKTDTTDKEQIEKGEDIIDKISETPYKDISGHWAEDIIKYILEIGLVDGVTETEFKPDEPMTREGFFIAMARLAGITENHIDWAIENGIILGYGNGEYGLQDTVTREQMAVIFKRFFDKMEIDLTEYKTVTKKQFADHDSISSWAVDDVYEMQEIGLVKGKNDNIFDPLTKATRAEASTVLYNLIQLILNDIEG